MQGAVAAEISLRPEARACGCHGLSTSVVSGRAGSKFDDGKSQVVSDDVRPLRPRLQLAGLSQFLDVLAL